jgi:hypothetical protein
MRFWSERLRCLVRFLWRGISPYKERPLREPWTLFELAIPKFQRYIVMHAYCKVTLIYAIAVPIYFSS